MKNAIFLLAVLMIAAGSLSACANYASYEQVTGQEPWDRNNHDNDN